MLHAAESPGILSRKSKNAGLPFIVAGLASAGISGPVGSCPSSACIDFALVHDLSESGVSFSTFRRAFIAEPTSSASTSWPVIIWLPIEIY